MERDGLQAAILGQTRHLHGDQFLVVPAGAELHGERNRNRGAHFTQDALDQRQVAQQARAAVALDHFVHRAAEVDVEDIEAQILADARGVGHHRGIGAEKLRGNRMLLGLEGQIFQGSGGLARP